MPRIEYSFEERDTVMVQVNGKSFKDITVNLNGNGIPQTCFCEYEDEPPTEYDETTDMHAALEYLCVVPEE